MYVFVNIIYLLHCEYHLPVTSFVLTAKQGMPSFFNTVGATVGYSVDVVTVIFAALNV